MGFPLGKRCFQGSLGLLPGLRFAEKGDGLLQRRFCGCQLCLQPLLLLQILGEQGLQQGIRLPDGELPFLRPEKLLRVGSVRTPLDAADVLPDASHGFLPLGANGGGGTAQLVLQDNIQVRVENAPENLLPVPGVRQQQLQEIPLGDHGYLGELLPVKAQDLPNRRVYLPGLGEDTAVRAGQAGIGCLLCHALPPVLGAYILRVPGDGIRLPGISEVELHKGGRLGVGIFGAEHGRFPVVAACLPKQGEADGIKQGGFPRAGVPGDEVQTAVSQLLKIQLHLLGIGAKGGKGQL